METEELILNLLGQLLHNLEEINRMLTKIEKKEAENRGSIEAYLCTVRDEIRNDNII